MEIPDPTARRASKRRGWVTALVTLAVLAVVGAVTLVGLGIYLFVSHVDVADATPESAAATFDETRARFAGHEPLIQVSGPEGDVQASIRRRPDPSRTRPEALHLMIWDPNEERLVNVRIPLWLLRLSGDGSVSFSAEQRDIVGDLDLSVADIDHHGPGLVLDYQDADRERVLLWAE